MAIGFAHSDPDYARSWRDLRRREAVFWIVALSYLPGVALALLAVHLARRDVPERFALWVGGGWIATYVIASLYRLGFDVRDAITPSFGPGWNQAAMRQRARIATFHAALRRIQKFTNFDGSPPTGVRSGVWMCKVHRIEVGAVSRSIVSHHAIISPRLDRVAQTLSPYRQTLCPCCEPTA